MSIFGADIRTIQIIEKGSWDEVFSINGGGHVHLKLHFSLSDEDRDRIRVMVMFLSAFSFNASSSSTDILPILLLTNEDMTSLKDSNSI